MPNFFCRKFFLCLCLLCAILLPLGAETPENESEPPLQSKVSPLLAFHDIGKNFLNSITWNYGLNFVGAGFGTWALIETGFDWKFRNILYNTVDNTRGVPSLGIPMLAAGYLVPVITPVSVYLAGRFRGDAKLQIAGAALLQSLVLTQAFHLPLKMITGRAVPGLISDVFFEPNHFIDERTDDFSGEFHWFKADFMDGWPSGHTASAFSAAAVLSEIYKDNTLLKVGVYSYAALTAFSVGISAHWVSDVVAGALIGYAVGKAVGVSFNRLLGKTESGSKAAFYAAPNSIRVSLSLP